jgi:glycosyltransferase involved in cell wall biosynthesis
MRILYFTRDYTSHDYRFLSALSKTEHKIFYLRLERGQVQFEDRPLPPEIEQISWSGGQRSASLWDGPKLLLSLDRVIRQVKPDLIQAGPLQRSAFLVTLAGFHPLVSMSWGYDLIQDAYRNASWRCVTRYTLKHSDVMLGDCHTIRQIARSFGMPDERIVTFPWGIDLDHFSPSDRKDDMHPFTLLSTRGWEPVYGVDIIAKAFVLAAQKRPHLHMVMLGNGSQAVLLRKILDLHAGNNQPLHVSFPGQVSHADLPRYYRSADLYVSASHSDGTSISLLEALACGLPALVSDIPGNREWVTPDEQGWLFPDGDVETLSKAIIQAFDKRSQLVEMRSAARRLAEQRADWNHNFQMLFQAYDIALNKLSCK